MATAAKDPWPVAAQIRRRCAPYLSPHHHCVVIDAAGKRLLWRRVINDEPDLLALIADVTALGDQVTWAVDLPDGGAALLIGRLVAADQPVLYLPGRAVNRASGTYRGEARPMPGTPPSSPTRRGCAATSSRCAPAMTSRPS